ncbi:unnamed protein product [Rhizoctonia solani]|uniref:Uncharacterized protein n=1 Tax=Rhizoctonia solani TaxID=456999 RepID=A0A8H2XG63_9AGAM|nr:unnamed protein product [Rhizoctonia solani]
MSYRTCLNGTYHESKFDAMEDKEGTLPSRIAFMAEKPELRSLLEIPRICDDVWVHVPDEISVMVLTEHACGGECFEQYGIFKQASERVPGEILHLTTGGRITNDVRAFISEFKRARPEVPIIGLFDGDGGGFAIANDLARLGVKCLWFPVEELRAVGCKLKPISDDWNIKTGRPLVTLDNLALGEALPDIVYDKPLFDEEAAVYITLPAGYARRESSIAITPRISLILLRHGTSEKRVTFEKAIEFIHANFARRPSVGKHVQDTIDSGSTVAEYASIDQIRKRGAELNNTTKRLAQLTPAFKRFHTTLPGPYQCQEAQSSIAFFIIVAGIPLVAKESETPNASVNSVSNNTPPSKDTKSLKAALGGQRSVRQRMIPTSAMPATIKEKEQDLHLSMYIDLVGDEVANSVTSRNTLDCS